MKINTYLDKLDDLKGQTLIVSGGTSGIGLSLVRHLLYKNASVVILARNLLKAEKIRNELLKEYPNSFIDIIEFDQSNFDLIASASKQIEQKYPGFDGIILNAGIFKPSKNAKEKCDWPLTLLTNYIGLGYFLDNLMSFINDNQKVILQGSFVSSYHIKKKFSLKDKSLSDITQYNISKAGVEALYHYYKTNYPNYHFYLTEPGLVSTDIIRDFSPFLRKVGKAFLKFVSHSSDKAALTIMFALKKETKNHSYIVPRGLFNFMGYPKLKKFPKRRERQYLVNKLLEFQKD